MSNIQPIKVEATRKPPYKFVEWKLHDKCNYNCYFCGDENKLGKYGWQDLETNKKIVDGIVEGCKGSPFWIQLTGGEPTLYPKFKELLLYMKEKGAMIRVISNGSRTIRWWKEICDADVIDSLFITFHSQQNADYKHITEVLNLFHDKKTITVSVITYVPNSISYALEGAEYITEHTGSYVSMNAMDLRGKPEEDKTFDEDQYQKVLNEYNIAYGKQLDTKTKTDIPEELIQNVDIVITYDDGSTIVKDSTLMMKTGENKFEGWDCYAGIDSINIEPNMKFRGGCKRDPTPMNLGEFSFFDKPFKCDVDACYCSLDMITTKIKNTD